MRYCAVREGFNLQVHRVDHSPRCFPFDMLSPANDSRPCTVWFSDKVRLRFDSIKCSAAASADVASLARLHSRLHWIV